MLLKYQQTLFFGKVLCELVSKSILNIYSIILFSTLFKNKLVNYSLHFIPFPAVDIESIVSHCCNEGNDWGSQRKHCNEYKFNLDKNVVPAGLHGLCLSTVEICCAKQHRIYQCTGE